MGFFGFVQDDDRGPFMLLEFCKNGALKDYVVKSRDDSSVELEEKLFRISLGICRGMVYLASKQVVHRRLAARNILLDDMFEPKIAGFGPDPEYEEVAEGEASTAPFKDVETREVATKLQNGDRMKKPKRCNDSFYNLMLKCWDYDPTKRPRFEEIKAQLLPMFKEGPEEEYYFRSNEI